MAEAVGPRRQRAARRRRRRWGRALTALGLTALVLGGGLFGAGRLYPPRVRWQFSPRDSRLTVRLEARDGWLGHRLAAFDTWRVGPYAAGSALHPFIRTLTPGQAVRWRVTVRGPAPARAFIAFTAPAGPRLLNVRRTATTLVLTADRPILAVTGAPVSRLGRRRLVLKRGLEARTLALQVEGTDGARNRWRVPVPAARPVPVVWFGAASGGRVYLTVDDGWFPSARLLGLMQAQHLPVTAFLIQDAAAGHPAYWRAFVQAGGVIEDHTVSHPDLARIPVAAVLSQWQGPVTVYPRWFGQTPVVGRPPYGALSRPVRVAARVAGLKALVMWGVEWNPGRGFQTWNGGPITAGDIILLHWVPGVGRAVEALLPELKARGLTPAPLLPGIGLAPGSSPALLHEGPRLSGPVGGE